MKNILEAILQKKGDDKDVPVAFIFKNDKLLIGLRTYTPDKWKAISVWTAPGGRCNNGETLETTLRREVFEEVGIDDLIITKYLGSVPGAKEGDIVLYSGQKLLRNRNLWNQKNSVNGNGVKFPRFLQISLIPKHLN